MQHLSSKKYEPLLYVSELFDGQSHQHTQGDGALLASEEVKAHLKNWALIGSTLRHEMPAQMDLNFADKVMARLENEQMEPAAFESSDATEFAWVPPCEGAMDPDAAERDVSDPQVIFTPAASSDESLSKVGKAKELEVKEESASEQTAHRPLFTLKHVLTFTTQIAIAASVAVVAIVGLQTYNAADPVLSQPASTVATNKGPVSGLSLASYQNSDSEVLMNLKQMPEPNLRGQDPYQSDVERKQQEELERINQYVQGYVLDTTANR